MKYLKISLILGLISLVCAVILAGTNMITKDKIAENEKKTKNETIEAIFSDYDKNQSEIQSKKDLKKYSSYKSVIEERIVAKDKQGNSLGYLYTATDSNSYGEISLMIALTEEGSDVYVIQVEFLKNTESFASTVDTWLKKNFVSKGTEVHEGGFKDKSVSGSKVNSNSLAEISLSCGATYGATTCMELITAACNLEKEVA